MLYPIGKLVDRYTILLLKKKYDNNVNNNLLVTMKKEIDDYYSSQYIDELYNINYKIWKLESDIRKGKYKELGLKEIGKRSIKIRKLNDIRVSIVNKINDITNTGWQEYKYE